MRKVGFGVIGVKGIGKLHIESILSSKNAELVAVADINEEEGKAVASKYHVEWYQNYENMLERKDIDAVSVCTPHFLHCPMSLKALEYGKHVLVEKPIALTVKEADRMIEKARNTGLKLGVVFQLRTFPVNREIKRLLDSGEIGKLYRATMEVCTFRSQKYYESDSWRGKWATEGGGVLINQTIHNIDLLQWLIGKPVCLQGQVDTLYHKIEVEDIASAVIKFEKDVHGLLHVSTVDPVRTSRLEICGEEGQILVEKEARLGLMNKSIPEFIAGGDEKPACEWVDIKPEIEAKGGHLTVIDEYAEAIIEDKEPPVPGEEGRTSLEIVNAIILSSFEGKKINFPIDREAYERLMLKLKEGLKVKILEP